MLPVLNGIDLDIPQGQITVILGQSGCGKTTLLRLTGGLEPADSGEILWKGNHKTAFVFQEPRLMPWLTVWDNVVFGLKKAEQDNRKNRRASLERWGFPDLRKPIRPSFPAA